MVLEFGQHRKRASPGLSIYIYSSTYIHAYICCLHGISCSDQQLEHHCFEHSSLAVSLKYLPIKWIVKQQNPKFCKMLVLAWWCWNLTDITRELALIYLSTSIHLYLYLHIYIYAYISCLHGISCSDPHLEHHSFPDLFVYIYLSTYIHAYISCLHGISCSDPHLEHHCFERSSLSLSHTHEMDCQITKP